MSRNIVLTGFMGAGKSLVAKMLASRLNRQLVSTDDLIESQEGIPIAEIFAHRGEKFFRVCEERVVGEIAEQDSLVVDCGGGVVLSPQNMAKLKRHGILFYLSASANEIFQRTKHQVHRPLLTVDNPEAKIQELLDQRKSFYEQADYTVDTDGKSGADVCEKIVSILETL